MTEDCHVLSFAQQRMWMLHLLEPDNHAYMICSAVRVTEALDIEVVSRAVAVLVERHEALRTVFRAGCDAPYAVILPAQPVPVELVDFRDSPPEENDSRVSTLAEQEARRPISLSEFPLFRFTVARLAADESVLILAAHHIIADDWSRTLLLSELAALIHAFSRGLPNPLPPVRGRFVEHARAQVEALTQERSEHLAAYWRDKLAGDLSPLRLPSDQP